MDVVGKGVNNVCNLFHTTKKGMSYNLVLTSMIQEESI